MSLEPGRELAHYEILEPMGQGGLGKVYRAKVGKLGRDVAIKVLPESTDQIHVVLNWLQEPSERTSDR